MTKMLILVLTTFCLNQISSQVNTSFEERTDALFTDFNVPNQPGITMGIVEKGKVLYLKGFGTANLETSAPIDLNTKFQADDFAKQFTVLSILLLEEQGKVGMEDDIRKYLPELPNYSEVIQLKHLVNHTSGLNDYYAVNRLLGASLNDIFTHQDALLLISAQKELNHTPGTRFSLRTSDTEMTLLAEIVAKVSGKSLAQYAKEFIFEPLQMSNTLFSDDYNMIIPNLAKSYQATETGYKYKVTNSGNAGPTNLFISARDMATWYAQFSPTKTGFALKIQQLHEPVKLDNGKTNHNSWGLMTLARDFYHLERGVPKYWLFGLHGGYGANMFLFPEQDIVSFAIGNNDSYNGYYGMVPLEPILEEHYTAPPIVDFASLDTKVLKKSALKQYEGDFWDEESQSSRKIFLKNDTLQFGRPGTDLAAPLIPLSDRSFQMVVQSDDVIILKFEKKQGRTHLSVISGGSNPTEYVNFDRAVYSTEELEEYSGTFYNSDLSLVFEFKVEEGQLISNHLRNGSATYSPEMDDVFRSSAIYFSSISYERNKKGVIKGFRVTSPGIKDLLFLKTEGLSEDVNSWQTVK